MLQILTGMSGLYVAGEELEISMHQTKSDNLDEIMASYMEHSNADDLDQSHDDSSDTSSDLDSGVKVTQVKVSIHPPIRSKRCILAHLTQMPKSLSLASLSVSWTILLAHWFDHRNLVPLWCLWQNGWEKCL